MVEIDTINSIYEDTGFDGVIEYIKGALEQGMIIQKTDDIYCIITCGWHDDENIINELLCLISFFADKHYIGYIRGGAYYFSKSGNLKAEIINTPALICQTDWEEKIYIDTETDREYTQAQATREVAEWWDDMPADYCSWYLKEINMG